ncbi:MAG: efflux RND transporter periplasmic adaptor subunit [Gemmatimonadaceae bacterium]
MPVSNAVRIALLCLAGLACGKDEPKAEEKAATVANPVKESALATISLGEEAERRLRIAVDTVAMRRLSASRSLPGEVMAIPGMSQQLVAPVAGRVVRVAAGELPVSGRRVSAGAPVLTLVPIAQDRDLLRSTEELQVARARLTRAQLEAERVAALWRDRLVSARDKEVADAEQAMARAAFDAAEGRSNLAAGARGVPAGVSSLTLRSPLDGVVLSLFVGEGQVVAAGAPLVEIARLDAVWLRVRAYVGDLSRLDARATAAVHRLGATATAAALTATHVTAPPNANAASASSDLYYVVAKAGHGLRPGERVQVSVPERGQGSAVLTVPWAAVVFDHDGGTWVYERVAPRQYTRRRVAIGTVSGGWAEVRSGIGPGAAVVTDGAAELWGTEFGAGK